MTQTAQTATVQIITTPGHRQATGAFDFGRITERKPIGFPQDGGGQRSVGPLFYWAWAQSDEKGTIALHPHQGFEILSYVLDGELNHRDTLDNHSRVDAGGVQVQQAGSGLSHEEITGPGHTAFFQIWFQTGSGTGPAPSTDLLRAPPRRIPAFLGEGVSTKTILGTGSPIELHTDATMHDITVEPGATLTYSVKPDHALVMVTLEGQGNGMPRETRWAKSRPKIAR